MLITKAEYARQRGVTPAAVCNAIRRGTITAINDKIDPEVANIQWAANRKRALNVRDTPARDATGVADRVAPATGPDAPSLDASRRRREFHEANLAEMRERQKAGELVELAQVHLAYTTLAAQLRAALERIPDKLAPRLAAESDEHTVHTLLLTELDQALLDMAQQAAILPAQLAARDG